MSSPVAGFNSNVRHRGSVFHIQTEDSGTKNPRIVTHLFADGGRILRTLKTDYRSELERPDLIEHVRMLMRQQHKTMYVSLRGGELDELIEEACGALSLPASRVPVSQLSMPPELSSLSMALSLRSLTPSGRRAAEVPAREEEPSAIHVLPVPDVVKQRGSTPPKRASGEVPVTTSARRPGPRSEPPPASARPERPAAQMRPAARSAALPKPVARAVHADDAIREQSLDDVILSYLADDLKAPSK